MQPTPVLLTLATLLALSTGAARATTFQVSPLDLGSGFTLSGTISTDGATGVLTGADVTAWSLKVTSITDIVYTHANTANVSSNVFSDGNQLLVPTSPDGSSDGGSLAFYGGRRFQVQVADFTGANTQGGQAFYVAGGAFDFLPLNRPNGTNYVAANVDAPGGNVFDLVAKTFSGGEVMSGTITTDGAVGLANITDWTIRIRDTQTWWFNPGNSAVLNDLGLMSDGKTLTVTPFDTNGNPGAFSIGGFSHLDFNGVLLGDFTYDPGGVAGYISPLIYQTISPVPLDNRGLFVVGAAIVPEPATWSLMIVGLGGLGAGLRARRRLSIAGA